MPSPVTPDAFTTLLECSDPFSTILISDKFWCSNRFLWISDVRECPSSANPIVLECRSLQDYLCYNRSVTHHYQHFFSASVSRTWISDDFWWIPCAFMFPFMFVILRFLAVQLSPSPVINVPIHQNALCRRVRIVHAKRNPASKCTWSFKTIRMIFDVDSNSVHPGFWNRALTTLPRDDFAKIMKLLRNLNS